MVIASSAAHAAPVASARSATLFRSQLDTEHLLFQLSQLITRPRRFLELQVLGMRQHLLLERLDLARELLLAHGLKARPIACMLGSFGVVDAVDQVLDAL